MKCPACEKESADTDHCSNCGWKEATSALQASASPQQDQPQVIEEVSKPEEKPREQIPVDRAAAESVNQSPPSDGNCVPCAEEKAPNPAGNLEKAQAQEKASEDDPILHVPVSAKPAVEEPSVKASAESTGPCKPDNKKVDIGINDSRFEQYNNVGGANNIIAHSFQVVLKEKGHSFEEDISVLEVTSKLYPKSSDIPEFESDETKNYLERLKKERLILIGCHHETVALAAAYALTDGLGIADDERKRKLNFESRPMETYHLSLQLFLKKRADSDAPIAIIVDAMSNKAQTFLDYLFGSNENRSRNIKEGLRGNGVYLICLADPEEIDKASKEERRQLEFTHWSVPFLRHFLKHYYIDQYIEMEKLIAEQRKQGLWNKDEGKFCREIKGLHRQGKLVEATKSPQSFDNSDSITSKFKGDGSVTDTVLYVATFFQDLSPNEFNRVVSSLLAYETASLLAEQNKADGEKPAEEGAAQKEKLPIQVWKESPDKILQACRLITSRGSARVITFSDARQRDELKEYLEANYSIYLENKFNVVQEQCLLFDNSENIAESMIRLSVEMAVSYPENYGRTWLFELSRNVKRSIEPGPSRPHAADRSVNLLRQSLEGKPKEQAYKRVSELIRRLLAHPKLERAVKGSLEQLLSAKLHDSALHIVKGLRFAPQFDEFYWMKLLVDQADEATRLQARAYLYGEMKKMNLQVYEVLNRLESWLPETERDYKTYSCSNQYALSLFIEYCLEITLKFDPKNYGAWPSAFPLLAFKDRDSAERNLNLLTRWLFHPGVKCVLDSKESDPNLINAMVAEWIFFLLGQPEQPAAADNKIAFRSQAECAPELQQQPGLSSDINACDLQTILLEQVLMNTDTPQQKQMLTYWDELKNFISFVLGIPEYSVGKQRKQLLWKLSLMKDLLKQFRDLQRLSKNSQRQKSCA